MKAIVLETEQELNYQKNGLQVLKNELLEVGEVAADTVIQKLGVPSSSGEVGGLFRHPEFRKYAFSDGAKISQITGNLIHIWRLKPDANIEELKESIYVPETEAA